MGAHSENIVLFFPSMGEENRHDGVLLLNEHGGLCVFSINGFRYTIYSIESKKIMIKELAEKKIEQ